METCKWCGASFQWEHGWGSPRAYCSQRCYVKSGGKAKDDAYQEKYDNFVKGWIAFSEKKSVLAFIPRVLWFAGETLILGGIVFFIEAIIGTFLEESAAAMNGAVLQFVLGWLHFVLWFAESGIKGILILLFGSAIVESIIFQFIGKRAAIFGQNCCLILIAIGTIIGKII